VSVNLTRYALWFMGASLVVMTIVAILQQGFGLQLGTGFTPILPAMVAAMVEGSKWAKVTREKLRAPWLAAGAMTLVAVAITSVLLLATTLSATQATLEGVRVVGTIMAVYAAFWFLTNRIFLSMGARNEWAAQDRRGA